MITGSWFLANQDLWRRLMVSFCMLGCGYTPLESDSWCTHPTAFWTGKGFGRAWLGFGSLFLPPESFLCSFMPVCLQLMTCFSHWWMPTVSDWGLLLPWPMPHGWFPPVQVVSSAGLCKAFLEYHGHTCLSSLKKTALGMWMSSILVTWPAQCSCTWSKIDSLLCRQAVLRNPLFDT